MAVMAQITERTCTAKRTKRFRSQLRIAVRRDRGYVLLSLLLGVSLLVIAAAAIAPTIASQIRRERETELIHRAAEYRHAVRRFAKHTGRYPMSLDDLQNTNGVRYLRKRYKDPITGRDFRVLHMADIPASLGTSASNWSLQPAANTQSESREASMQAEQGNVPQDLTPSPAVAETGAHPPAATDSSSASQSSTPAFGGGVIIGVASTSKQKTIREFDHRSRYNQWLFFYNPAYERSFEVHGPTPLTHPPQALQSAAEPSRQTDSSQPNSPAPSPTPFPASEPPPN